MGYTTHKNGDEWGMVYYCYTDITEQLNKILPTTAFLPKAAVFKNGKPQASGNIATVIQAAEHESKDHHQALAFPLPVLMILCRAAGNPRRLEGHPRVGPWRRQRQPDQLRRRQGVNARGAGAQHQGAQQQLQRDMGQVLKNEEDHKGNITQLLGNYFAAMEGASRLVIFRGMSSLFPT